ncbi:protein PHYTOCHROME KINASE SUBSTRATE 4-like [Tasmannia lanceolata]|uniref:protein PHYTOCHROME KINASE SUBSTRATE 4-like n=1 Tax=Tasmannia lanceolata TaxID=3420 RepID=UPI004063FD20
MERLTVRASFNGGISHRPSYESKEIFLSNPSFSSKPNLRDISFSTYPPPEAQKPVSQERPGDTEISIFDAKKYFKENPDPNESKTTFSESSNLERIVERCEISTIPRPSSISSVDKYGRNYINRSFNATPTASSEASWNSQSGLLSNPPGSVTVSLKNLPLKKGSPRRWVFGRKCPCSGKKSVEVGEKFSEPKILTPLNSNSSGSLSPKKQIFKAEDKATKEKTEEIEKSLVIKERANLKLMTGNWAKEQVEIGRRIVPSGGFSFPILNPAAAGKVVINGRKPASPPEDPPRDSIEVFNPKDETLVRTSTEFQRRLMMPFSDHVGRQSFTFSTSPKACGRLPPADDDVASDSSSDLFEIESFSTQTTSYPKYRRQDLFDQIYEDTTSVSPLDCRTQNSFCTSDVQMIHSSVSNFEARRFFGNGDGILNFRRSFDETTTSIAPTEWYEPSEASVDWSVTTAEAFDRGSVTNFSIAASEYEEVRFVQSESMKVSAASGSSKRRGNGLLGCQSENAVSVGPHPVKFGGTEQRRVGPPQFFPVVSGRISAIASGVSDKPPLARAHSSRLSRSFARR